MRSSKKKRTGKRGSESRGWDDRQRYDDWQRYVRKETQRLKQKSGGQVVELSFSEQEPAPPPSEKPPADVVEQPVTQVIEARSTPVPAVPREEALQVSNDEIGRTVKPFTYSDYKKIRPLTSPDIFKSGDETPAEEADPEPVQDPIPLTAEEVGSESKVVGFIPAKKAAKKIVEKTQPQVKEKPARRKDLKKKKGSGGDGELELFDSVSEHQLVSRQRLTRKSRLDREELIEKLLDPVISLEEAATLIGVCKTTVRRYTNKGQLDCLRTPGQQRRFKLSQVLEFVEKRKTVHKSHRKFEKEG